MLVQSGYLKKTMKMIYASRQKMMKMIYASRQNNQAIGIVGHRTQSLQIETLFGSL